MQNANINLSNKSPLRYPGGKTRACKKLDQMVYQYFDMQQIQLFASPFFGGGSFEFYLQNKYKIPVKANDKFIPLYNFWQQTKTNNANLCQEIAKLKPVSKEQFQQYRDQIMSLNDNPLLQAAYYFVINRSSFSGATLSGGFSKTAAEKRFTKSSIDRVSKLNLNYMDFENSDYDIFFRHYLDSDEVLMFLDPPYYLEKKSKLYGQDGNMHSNFNHLRLFNRLNQDTNTIKKWIMTYNDCKYIRDLYKDTNKYIIIDVNWSYGMNKSKKSSEIVIIKI